MNKVAVISQAPVRNRHPIPAKEKTHYGKLPEELHTAQRKETSIMEI
jgi:hypothetical protein